MYQARGLGDVKRPLFSDPSPTQGTVRSWSIPEAHTSLVGTASHERASQGRRCAGNRRLKLVRCPGDPFLCVAKKTSRLCSRGYQGQEPSALRTVLGRPTPRLAQGGFRAQSPRDRVATAVVYGKLTGRQRPVQGECVTGSAGRCAGATQSPEVTARTGNEARERAEPMSRGARDSSGAQPSVAARKGRKRQASDGPPRCVWSRAKASEQTTLRIPEPNASQC